MLGVILVVFIFCLFFGIYLILFGGNTMLYNTMGTMFIVFSIMILSFYFVEQDREEAQDIMEEELIEELIEDIKNILGDEAEFFNEGINIYDYKIRIDNHIYDVLLDNEKKEIEYIFFNNEIIYEKESKLK